MEANADEVTSCIYPEVARTNILLFGKVEDSSHKRFFSKICAFIESLRRRRNITCILSGESFYEDETKPSKVPESLYHWEAKTYECPYGSTGEWEIYCDQGEVPARLEGPASISWPVNKDC